MAIGGAILAVGLPLLVAAGAWALYGGLALNYDTAYSLVWAQQILSGELPRYDALGAPTPHPLTILLGVPVAALGFGGAYAVLVAVSYALLALLAAQLFRLGKRAHSSLAGFVAVAVVGSSYIILVLAASAAKELLYLTLILGAALLAIRGRRYGLAALALLALAGLIRPDAWLLAALWGGWLVYRRSASLAPVTALVAAPPLLWIASDVVISGGFFSLNETRDLAVQLGRPTGLEDVPAQLAFGLVDLVTVPVLVAALFGCVVSMRRRNEVDVLLLGVTAAGGAAFMVQGAVGLPLTSRLLVLLAVALAVLGGVGAAAFLRRSARRGASYRRAGLLLAAGMVVVLSVPGRLDDLRRARGVVKLEAALYSDLRRILDVPSARAAFRRCPTVTFVAFPSGALQVPYLAFELERDPDDLVIAGLGRSSSPSALLLPATGGPIPTAGLVAPHEVARHRAALAGGRRPVAANQTWQVYTRGC